MKQENESDMQPVQRDHLTDFMFGGTKNRKEHRNADHSEAASFAQRRHLADDWFIGHRGQEEKKKDRNKSHNGDIPFIELLNQVDLEKLSGNIDTLMSTASQFKPLIKQVTPLLKKWIK
ncbi:hypothetical protein [Bacillus benzoevorans]|uniref:Uncharacterized protein n=1 Tax=Bacillus benzoevorans TaxID=1456 RepID=A0A7X0HQ16_9BACI|nr:hypothetical protein [Bacillus benzoevorans]MBB6443540.1 hypothetical protein [Bacillus benzoevorans]